MSLPNLMNPRIPGPPPLGSLESLRRVGSSEKEPEPYRDTGRRDEGRSKAQNVGVVTRPMRAVQDKAQKPVDAETTVDEGRPAATPETSALDTLDESSEADRVPRRSGSRVILFIGVGSFLVAAAILALSMFHR
jgi:hypothetical protein